MRARTAAIQPMKVRIPTAAPGKSTPGWFRSRYTPMRPAAEGLAIVIVCFIGIVSCTPSQSAVLEPKLHATNISVPDSLQALEFQGRGRDSIQVIRGSRVRSPRHRAGPIMLYARLPEAGAVVPIPGTEGVEWFAVEPNGRRVAYRAPRSSDDISPTLFLVRVTGGAAPREISAWDDAWCGPLIWASGDELLVARSHGTEFARLSLTTGRISGAQPIHADTRQDERTFECTIDGTSLAFMNATWRDRAVQRRGFGVLNLKDGGFSLLCNEGSHPRPAGERYVLYARRQHLVAARFDPNAPSPIDSGVVLDRRLWTPTRDVDGKFDVSGDGTLLMPFGNRGWSDRGAILVGSARGWAGTSGDRAAFDGAIRAAPNGLSLICDLENDRDRREVWEFPLTDSLHARRIVAVLGGDACSPVWSPDGTELAYARRSRDGCGIYAIPLDGSAPPRLLARVGNDRLVIPTSWASDGAWIACVDTTAVRSIVLGIHIRGQDVGSLGEIFSDAVDRRQPAYSPDAKLLAYEAGPRGAASIFVQEWSSDGPRGDPVRVSEAGSSAPVWGKGGATLFYVTPGAKIAAVTITKSRTLSVSAASTAWDMTSLEIAGQLYDVSPDGRLLGIRIGFGERGPSGFQLTPGYVAAIPMKLSAADQ